jgi:hypothetical protein
VKVSRVPVPAVGPETVAIVAEALVPLAHWRGVTVLSLERQELNLLERFVLEMGLSFGTVEPEDFAEVTSLPEHVLAGATWRLVASGALAPDGPGFRVDAERAASVLREAQVPRQVRASASFALFPRTGDLLAVPGEDGGWLRELDQRIATDRWAPLPPDLWKVGRAAYLGQRVREGATKGLSSSVADVPIPDEGDTPLVAPSRGKDSDLPLCPAYRCRAEVRRGPDGGHAVDAVLLGRPRRSGDDDELVTVEANISGATGLVSGWLTLADALETPEIARAAWHELGPSEKATMAGVRRRGPAEWDLYVAGTVARDLCEEGRFLLEPMGLAITGEEAVVEVACRFFPGDDDARTLFARDEIVSRLLAAKHPAEEFPAIQREALARHASTSAALSAESVRRRGWRLGHHQLVYALREREDFAYD